jgi:hypothetical protein
MSNLTRYNQSSEDKLYPDHEETVLGHMVLELQVPLATAVQRLKPWVKTHTRNAERAKTWGLGLTVVGVGGGLAIAATLGVSVGFGLGAIFPALGGLWNLTYKFQSDKEHTARDAEYLLLQTCPELVKLIYALAQRGMPTEIVVEAYDDLVHNFQANYAQISSTGILNGIDLEKEGIGQAFKDLIEEKMNMEVFSHETVHEFDKFQFGTIATHSEATAPLPNSPFRDRQSPLVGAATQLGAIEAAAATTPVISNPAIANPAIVNPAIAQQQSRKITDLPMPERALMVKQKLEESGFKLGEILSKSVTVIAGEQRGGKGTLLAMLGILMKAFNPSMKVLYFTAGSDLYPVGFDQVICSASFPGAEKPERLVFDELYKTVMGLKQYEHYEVENLFIVVDEAIALGDAADPVKNGEMAKFLLTQFSKTGAGAAIVLHASNLSAWLGIGNTGGLAQTFKTGSNFVGCVTQSIPNPKNPMRQLQIASGEYFLADPDNFGKKLKGADLGKVPDFLLTVKNPYNGSPDPVRSLLNLFPELINENPTTVLEAPKAASKQKPERSPETVEETVKNFWDGLQVTDHWASVTSDQSSAPDIGDEWRSTTVSAKKTPIASLDQQFDTISASLAAGQKGDALSISTLAIHFGLDEQQAAQLATVYAFKNKQTSRYDANQQALIKL